MGTYAYYYIGGRDGIESTVLENLPSLIKCLDICREKYPEDYDDVLFRKAVYLNEIGAASLTVDSSDQANAIDRVVDSLLAYEEYGSVHYKLFTSIDHSMMKWNRYARDLREVLPNSSDYACGLYSRLLFEGMSVAKCEGHNYQIVDGESRLAWALPHEIDRLVHELEPIRATVDWRWDKEHGVFCLLEASLQAREKGGSLIVRIN